LSATTWEIRAKIRSSHAKEILSDRRQNGQSKNGRMFEQRRAAVIAAAGVDLQEQTGYR
jgi:hypothetical protein